MVLGDGGSLGTWRGTWLWLVLGWVGCGNDAPAPTRLLLVADTDMPELDQVRFIVASPTGSEQVAKAPVAMGEPAWLAMDKSTSAPNGPYRVRVEGLSAGTPQIVRTALVSFEPGRTLAAPLHLVRRCVVDTCTGGLVCTADGCHEETLAMSELLPWQGAPPTLASRDAGATDAGALHDGGLPRPDAAIEPDASSGCENTCIGEDLGVCEAGQLVTRPCEQPGLCARASCSAGSCVNLPADEGDVCGAGVTCTDGVCGKGQSCTQADCSPSCFADVAACRLACGSAARCAPTCGPDQDCRIQCDGAASCLPQCRGDCKVDCGTSTNCRVGCSEGKCDVTCPEGGCNRVECTGGARCIMRCPGGQDCMFKKCDGEEQSCADGVSVCNRSCP